MLIKVIIYFLLLSPRHLGVKALLEETYRQVDRRFPSGMSNCLLKTISLHIARNKHIDCATRCRQTFDCRLFCIKGDECTLFKTFVTAEYIGTALDSFSFTSCYTSWFYFKNLAPQTVVTMPSAYSADYAEDKGTNGYFCYEYDSCSIVNLMTNPWWMADLQKTYFVSALVVKPRDDGKDFSNVEVRFGNSSTISKNPIFATYPGSAPPPGTVFTFKRTNPMEGRYLSFQILTSFGAVSICEVQIIEA